MTHTKSKQRNDFIHFRDRLEQRYKIKISRDDYRNLCNQVKSGRSIFLGRQTPGRTVHQVKLDRMRFIVVYNTNVGNITTVLYPGKTYKLVF